MRDFRDAMTSVIQACLEAPKGRDYWAIEDKGSWRGRMRYADVPFSPEWSPPTLEFLTTGIAFGQDETFVEMLKLAMEIAPNYGVEVIVVETRPQGELAKFFCENEWTLRAQDECSAILHKVIRKTIQ